MSKTAEFPIRWQEDSSGICFADLADLLNRSFDAELEPTGKPGWEQEKEAFRKELSQHNRRGFTEEHVKITFSRSYAVEYAFDGNRLIACGRALSDGIEQAAIYNIAVDPDYQGLGLGRAVVEKLLDQVKGCEAILYTHPQTVKFYETLGWRRQKTGFVTWSGQDDPEAVRKLEETGFLLPKGFRYQIDESNYYDINKKH